MPKGKVSFIVSDRKFGFILPDDGSEKVHFNFRGNPDQVQVSGVEVEYVLGPMETGKSPHATRVELPGVLPPELVNRTTAPAPSASPPKNDDSLGITIEIGDHRSIEEIEKIGDSDEVKKVQRLMLPVLVTITKGNQPAKQVEVVFEPEGVHNVRNGWDVFHTDQEGHAYSQVLVEPDTEDTIITIRAAGKNYSKLWEKNPKQKTETPTEPPTATEPVTPAEPTPPQTQEPPKVATAIKVFSLGRSEVDGYTTFRVMTLVDESPNADGTPGEFLVESGELLEDVDTDGETDTDHSLSYGTDEFGQDMVRIQPIEASEAEVHFRLANNPSKSVQFTIKKKEESSREPAKEPTPTATEPPKIQKIYHSPEGVYTFRVETTPKISIRLSGIAVLARQLPCEVDAVWNKGPFNSGGTGVVEIEVKVEKSGDRGSLVFCVGDLRSAPQHVVHALPPEPPKK
ncbi:MAG: hypothetical protein KW804_00820 [Candidatus Doudnabacteria bacterium]|nr:hypothetical protein [Candidatus Doudnabacteria bacterium]